MGETAKKPQLDGHYKTGPHIAEIIKSYQGGLSAGEIGKLLGIERSAIRQVLRLVGIQLRSRRVATSGVRNKRWNGGRTRHDEGYVMVKRPGHPRANHHGYVMASILVAEDMIGRPLREDECVHHKNQIRDDDHPENLEVLTKREHKALHARLLWVRARENNLPTLAGLGAVI